MISEQNQYILFVNYCIMCDSEFQSPRRDEFCSEECEDEYYEDYESNLSSLEYEDNDPYSWGDYWDE